MLPALACSTFSFPCSKSLQRWCAMKEKNNEHLDFFQMRTSRVMTFSKEYSFVCIYSFLIVNRLYWFCSKNLVSTYKGSILRHHTHTSIINITCWKKWVSLSVFFVVVVVCRKNKEVKSKYKHFLCQKVSSVISSCFTVKYLNILKTRSNHNF